MIWLLNSAWNEAIQAALDCFTSLAWFRFGWSVRRHDVGVNPAAGNRRFPHPIAIIA
jgi:hypothetical protein